GITAGWLDGVAIRCQLAAHDVDFTGVQRQANFRRPSISRHEPHRQLQCRREERRLNMTGRSTPRCPEQPSTFPRPPLFQIYPALASADADVVLLRRQRADDVEPTNVVLNAWLIENLRNDRARA